MRKINILTKNIYNRIAAGEVIDRPYSAVKELVENSLDAKATEIEIYIEKGGKQLIKVADNGVGIERDDMRAAFLPHATSKISGAEDLDRITTLGFRGEALASISVISKVELISVTKGNSAYKITCEDGKTGEILPAARETGTEITVRNLFYNTPVRAKFMKPDKKEETDITNFISRFILGNPSISFRYYVDGKLTLQSFGGGLDEAVAQVYGAKTLSQCFKIDAEKDGIKLKGFIGNQNFFKPNKTYQSLFLNGRYIVNNTIATAVSQAYASYAMKRQYPFYVLFLEVPYDIVDVNVHPSKADVRFMDNKFILGIVYSVLSSILDGTAKAAEFVVENTRIPEIKSNAIVDANRVYGEQPQKSADFAKLIEKYKPLKKTVSPEPIRTPSNEAASTSRTSIAAEKKSEPENDIKFFDPSRDLPLDVFMSSSTNRIGVSDNVAINTETEFLAKERTESKKTASEQDKIEIKNCLYKGNLFNTYLIYELGDCVYIIDQHAAHERLIYDTLKEKLKSRYIVRQPLLCPFIFEVNPSEKLFLENKKEILSDMGFGISAFGSDTYRIDEVPVDLMNIDIKNFIEDILSDISELKIISLDSILKDKIATKACKHAVKGGMALSEKEIEKLFEMIDGNIGLKCPHGRPICISLSKREIEKMFKRIV